MAPLLRHPESGDFTGMAKGVAGTLLASVVIAAFAAWGRLVALDRDVTHMTARLDHLERIADYYHGRTADEDTRSETPGWAH